MDLDLTVATGSPAPRRLAQYELQHCVGSGAMGVVYRARDVDLDRIVAVKVLHAAPDAQEQRQRLERFMREARAAARLSHPNVALIYQVGHHEGQSFIAMEWLDGGDLAAFVKAQGPMRWPDALALIGDAAAGLAAAHAAGLVHRDVKPSNLMRLADGRVKVVDFGLARWHETASESTATGALLGSPAYLAPELCCGAAATPASDVYALGCTLFQLLAGRPPYTGPHIAAVLQGHISQPVPALEHLVDGLPAGLVAIVERALAKDPAARYADAGALLADLHRVQADAALAATAVPNTAAPAAAPDAWTTTATVVEFEATAATRVIEVRGHVPVEPSRFIGRETEAAALAQALVSARLVTLTGPGGTGKSRLALHAARMQAARRPVWFVELAPLAAGHDVAAAVAAVLELREDPGQTPADALAKALCDEPTLLVLDNCEHVLDTAAPLAARLVEKCPSLQIIATSRQALGCIGEVVLPVPPLDCGSAGADAQKLVQSEAVRLFAQRARHARPGFSVDAGNAGAVAAICRQLDGLPLAIELAAARVKVLSVAQIAGRLTDALKLLTGGSNLLEPRQQTLRALIDWSYALLDADEARCFVGCSIFAGEFGIEAAEAVLAVHGGDSGDSGDSGDDSVLDLLAQLVDKSLLLAAEHDDVVRYRQLQTVRVYAAQKLRASGAQVKLARRHAEFFSSHCVEAVKQLRGIGRAGPLALLQRERDNVNAALDAAIEQRWFDVGTPLIAALSEYWFDQGRITEGMGRVERYLAVGPPQDAGYAALLRNAGTLALFQGRNELAHGWFERAFEIAVAVGDAALQARCLDGLGSHARAIGEFTLAGEWYGRAIDLSRQHGLGMSEAKSLNNLAVINDQQGRPAVARELYEAALAIHRQLGGSLDAAVVQMNLATSVLHADDPVRGEALFTACIELFDRAGAAWDAAYARDGLAECAMLRGDLDTARQQFEAALAVVREAGDRDHEAHALDRLARIALQQGQPERAREFGGRSLAMRLQINSPGDLASSLETMASIVGPGDAEFGARMLGCAQALRERSGQPMASYDGPWLEDLRAELGARLGPQRLASAMSQGRSDEAATLGRQFAR